MTTDRKGRFIVARFYRTVPAPKSNAKKNYGVFRQHVRKDFEECCAYCLRHEDWADGKDTSQIDHFRPKTLFEELICDFYNLYNSCYHCNKWKADKWPPDELIAKGIGFIDFRRDNFEQHFRALPDGRWV